MSTVRHHYPNLKRRFKSPLGIYGAYYAIFMFILALIGAVFFQAKIWQPLCFMAVYFWAVSVWYWLVSRHSQVISPEEEAVGHPPPVHCSANFQPARALPPSCALFWAVAA